MRFLPARGQTFDHILKINRGAGPGFDLLRFALALTILVAHCSMLTGNRGLLSNTLQTLAHLLFHTSDSSFQALDTAVAAAAATPDAVGQPVVKGLARPFTLSHLPMFFALSGFLVTGSALRVRRVWPFLGLRLIRIFPALCVEVTLSALVLGVLFTNLPLATYFSSPDFFAYFGNIVGIIRFHLPGVFVNTSPSDVVNGNLWTLPAEFHCYIIAAILMTCGLLFNRLYFTILFAICTIGLLIANTFFDFYVGPGVLDPDVNIYYFFTGVSLYMWRDRIVYNPILFVICVIFSYGLMFSTHTVFVYPFMLAYVTMFIGLTNVPKSRFLKSGDYSYGVYLYGFPLTQALIAIYPPLQGNMLALVICSAIVTLGFAFLSWHFVEKRFVALKRYLSPQSAQITLALHPDAVEGPHVTDAKRQPI